MGAGAGVDRAGSARRHLATLRALADADIEVTRLARDELRELIKTRQLPADTRDRVFRTLLTLEEFPRAGKQLSGVWRDCRGLIGPWGWLIVVYMYIEAEDRVVIIAFHDARTSEAATARL